MTDPARAVVLLSGGLDSTTLLALAREQGFDAYALSFRYGQRHAGELDAAARIADALGAVEHLVLDLGLGAIGGSALTADIAVPKDRAPEAMAGEIPVTYVPARNTIFLAYGLAWAEVLGADDIFIGVNALGLLRLSRLPARLHRGVRDHGPPRDPDRGRGYLDGQHPDPPDRHDQGRNHPHRPGARRRLRVHGQLLRPGEAGRACGECDACRLRLKGFAEAGLADPIAYATVARAGP